MKMPSLFYISDKKIELDSTFKSIFINELQINYTDDLNIIKINDNIFIGDGFDCLDGSIICDKKILELTKDNFLKRSVGFSGRYIILVEGRYLFTDATSSFSIYYNQGNVSNNLNELSKFLFPKNMNTFTIQESDILPPATNVNGILRLIPGQYFDFVKKQAHSIKGYLQKEKISTQNLKIELEKILVNSADGISKLSKGDYCHMLTGGRDSRLSMLSFIKSNVADYKSFTHKKKVFKNSINDVLIPKALSKKLKFSHKFTKPSKKPNVNLSKLLKSHYPHLTVDQTFGSTYYYYVMGNMSELKEKFLVDNDYALCRYHLDDVSLYKKMTLQEQKNYFKKIYCISDVNELILYDHIELLSNDFTFLEKFYFIKSYVNFANQFELIDFSHKPIFFNNSLILLNLLLSVPSELKSFGKFHDILLERLSPKRLFYPNLFSKYTVKILKSKLLSDRFNHDEFN